MASSVSPNTAVNNVAELQCSASGGPDNEFTWIRMLDGEVVGNEMNININIIGAIDGGIYMCTVQNSAGNGSDLLTLNGKNKYEGFVHAYV